MTSTRARETLPNEDQLFARNLRRLRESLGWSQAELADRLRNAGLLQMHATTVSRIEKGERIVRLGEGAQIARVLRTDISAMTRMLPEEAAELRESMIAAELAALELRRATGGFEDAQLKLRSAGSALDAWIAAHSSDDLQENEKAALDQLTAAASATLAQITKDHHRPTGQTSAGGCHQ